MTGQTYVTIAIVAYNAEETIDKCLGSIFALDYPRDGYEVIAVNNGSTDNTAEMLSKFPIDKVIELKTRISRGEARNICIREARGKIVVMPDADEVLPQNYLKELVKCFQESSVGFVWGARRHTIYPKKEGKFQRKVLFSFIRGISWKEVYG